MAVNIRFDYYNLKVDKKRKRSTDEGAQYFGRIPLSELCQWVNDYYVDNIESFNDHGITLAEYKYGKKWVKWVNASDDNGKLKLLFTFNDKQVDPRFLTDNADNVLAQPIPSEEHGQRTLLHIVFNPDNNSICVQNVPGFTKDFLIRLIVRLIQKVSPVDYWIATDPVTEVEIPCRPEVEIGSITTDEVLQSIHNGGLRGLVITNNQYQMGDFDVQNHLTSKKTKLTLRADGDSFLNTTRQALIEWANRVTQNVSDFQNPTVSLLVKDLQTGSEVEHEIIDGLIDNFGKKTFLNWDDRNEETHEQIKSEIPKPVTQFFDKMIRQF